MIRVSCAFVSIVLYFLPLSFWWCAQPGQVLPAAVRLGSLGGIGFTMETDYPDTASGRQVCRSRWRTSTVSAVFPDDALFVAPLFEAFSEVCTSASGLPTLSCFGRRHGVSTSRVSSTRRAFYESRVVLTMLRVTICSLTSKVGLKLHIGGMLKRLTKPAPLDTCHHAMVEVAIVGT